MDDLFLYSSSNSKYEACHLPQGLKDTKETQGVMVVAVKTLRQDTGHHMPDSLRLTEKHSLDETVILGLQKDSDKMQQTNSKTKVWEATRHELNSWAAELPE